MKVDKVGTHISHCCVEHGCKYGDDACPVANRLKEQEYKCEYCDIKKYLLVAGDDYYPLSRASDWRGTFYLKRDAEKALLSLRPTPDWYEIIDLTEWIYDKDNC